MKKYYSLFFLVIVFLLFVQIPESKSDTVIRTTDLLAAEGYVAYIVNSTEVSPEVVSECTCGGTKYVGDNGNLTKCPCGDDCKCTPKDGTGSMGDFKKKDPLLDEIYKQYYVIKFTASWCAPCQTWKNNEEAKLNNAGVGITEIDSDANPNIISQYKITSLPSFMICDTKERKIRSFAKGYQSADFLLNKILEISNGP